MSRTKEALTTLSEVSAVLRLQPLLRSLKIHCWGYNLSWAGAEQRKAPAPSLWDRGGFTSCGRYPRAAVFALQFWLEGGVMVCRDEAAVSPVLRPSPNHGDRRGAKVDLIILHYTAMESAEAAAARLTDPATEVSAHYLIARDGQVMALVPEERRAWHAGRSGWGSITDINAHSIGIELDNAGAAEDPAPAFAEPQMARLEALIDDIRARHAIPPERILGHACVAHGRKQDPGEKFDWRRLALEGRAVWLDPDPSAQALALDTGDACLFAAAARRIGYVFPEDGPDWSGALGAVWTAFAQRFLPMRARDPLPSPAAVAHAEALAARFPVAPGGVVRI